MHLTERKIVIELNEEQFRENIQYAKNSQNVEKVDKHLYEHFNDEEFNQGIPKKAQ